jgi:hypothetical protein
MRVSNCADPEEPYFGKSITERRIEMTKAKSNYSKLAALCAVLAMVLTQNVRPSLATAPPMDDTFKAVKIHFETQTISQYRENLITFLKSVDELLAKPSVSKAELAKVTQTADNLKRQASEVAWSVEAIIKKLKASGEWNNLNTLIQAKIKDRRVLSLLTQNSNINDRLLRAADEIRTGSGISLDGSVRGLNSKVIGQQIHPVTNREAQVSGFNVVRVGYHPATFRKLGFFACVVLGVFVISKIINGDITEDEVNQFLDNCG